MSNNSSGPDIVRELRRLLMKNGFNEDQTNLIFEKLQSELIQSTEKHISEMMRVTLFEGSPIS